MKTRDQQWWLISIAKGHALPRQYRLSFQTSYRLLWFMGVLVFFAFIGLVLGGGYFIKNVYHGAMTLHVAQLNPFVRWSPQLEPTLDEEPVQEAPQDMQLADVRVKTLFPPVSASIKGLNPIDLRISHLKFIWKDSQLRVQFAIEVNAQETKTYQGFIVMLVRGKNQLHFYPAQPQMEGDYFINPQHGERFSVSRYREVQASFGPFGSVADIEQCELYLFSLENQTLLHQLWNIHS